jgi:hypothetical protein
VTVPVTPDPQAIQAYEDAGADEAVIFMTPATEDEIAKALEQIARQILT